MTFAFDANAEVILINTLFGRQRFSCAGNA